MRLVRRGLWFALGLGAALALAAAAWVVAVQPPAVDVPPRSDAVLSGLTVIQPGIGRSADRTLVIRDGRIAELRARRPSDPEPVCPGCYAVPGLIDAHVHTPPRVALGNARLFALLHLAHGVTTVRDVGQADGSVATLARGLNRGEIAGPRMLRCGPVLDGDPPGWPMATRLVDPDEARALVEHLADEGVDCIKVYNEVSAPVFEAIARAAEERGLPLVGHVPHAVGLDGVRRFEAQHLTGIPYRTRPRPPHGWDLRNEDVLALSPAEIDAAIEVAREREVAFTPTLANFRLRLVASDPARFPAPPAAALLPAFWSRAWDLIAGHPTGARAIDAQLRASVRLGEIAGRLRARGVDVLAGTDTLMPWVVPGDALHRELAALEGAFGSAEAALEAATSINGHHLARAAGPAGLGSLEPGAPADLLLLPSDPTRDLGALRDWRVLFADGRRYERETLDLAVEHQRRHFRRGLYAAPIRALIARSVGDYQHSENE